MNSSMPPQHDLSSLRIDDRSRPVSRTGKRLGLFAAAVGAIFLLGSLLLAFRSQKPLVEVQVQSANADREAMRAQGLHTAGVISPQALDTAKTTAESLHSKIALTKEQIRAADSRIGVAKEDADNCIVRAPFDGIVVSKDAQRGEIVSPISAGGGFTRTGIATLVDMNSLEIEVDVNESYIARVQPGQRVSATLDAYPDRELPAKVRTVIPTADRQKA